MPEDQAGVRVRAGADEKALKEGGPEPAESVEQATQPCLPCHGSGKVISNLGGKRQELECPWCEGKGLRTAGIDAQAHWLGDQVGTVGDEEEDEGGADEADDEDEEDR